MTDPSQYFKGRTVQEQMNEVIGYVDTRSAEVATDAIAADVAQVHSDAADAHADALAAAASAAAAAGTLANAVKKTGEASQSIAGDIAVAGTLSGGVVTGTQVTVPAPVNNTDAATKKYVDDADALKMNITDINSYALGLTGNQTAGGVKSGNFHTLIGSPVYSSSDPTKYSSVCNLGAVGTPVSIGFSIVTRTNVCIGCIVIASNGTPSYNGIKGTTGNATTLGIGTVDGDLHLLVKRNTSAGQNIAMNIFGIVKGNTRINPTPGDIGDVSHVVNSLDYVEVVSL